MATTAERQLEAKQAEITRQQAFLKQGQTQLANALKLPTGTRRTQQINSAQRLIDAATFNLKVLGGEVLALQTQVNREKAEAEAQAQAQAQAKAEAERLAREQSLIAPFLQQPTQVSSPPPPAIEPFLPPAINPPLTGSSGSTGVSPPGQSPFDITTPSPVTSLRARRTRLDDIRQITAERRGKEFDIEARFGFSGIIDRPTKILVGEAGPEKVKITPLAKMPKAQNIFNFDFGNPKKSSKKQRDNNLMFDFDFMGGF